MAGERSAIFFGDLVEAVQALQIHDPETILAVSVLLGLQPQELMTLLEKDESESSTPQEQAEGQGLRARSREGSSTSTAHEFTGEAVRRSQIERLPSPAPAAQAAWSFEGEPLPRETEAAEPLPLPFEPLFVNQWTRGILGAAFATASEDGDLDLERIIDTIAARRYLARLPRLPLPTLRRGVQVLIDRSEALTPFFRDQEHLLEQIKNVVGVDLATYLWFAGCPSRGAGSGPAWEWQSYSPPSPGTVVVLLTDLGMTHPLLSSEWADLPEWTAFARQVRQAGCPLVALVPHAPARWPTALQRWMTILQWDRPTSASAVRSRVGHYHRVPR